MDEKNVLAQERVVVLQNLAETFLATNGAPSIEEAFEVPDIYGQINEQQTRMLRYYLIDELKMYGLDLEYYVTSRGQAFERGKLSQAEIDLLIKKADQMIAFIGTLEKRKKQAKESQ